jgi:hypothetical protein
MQETFQWVQKGCTWRVENTLPRGAKAIKHAEDMNNFRRGVLYSLSRAGAITVSHTDSNHQNCN